MLHFLTSQEFGVVSNHVLPYLLEHQSFPCAYIKHHWGMVIPRRMVLHRRYNVVDGTINVHVFLTSLSNTTLSEVIFPSFGDAKYLAKSNTSVPGMFHGLHTKRITVPPVYPVGEMICQCQHLVDELGSTRKRRGVVMVLSS